MSEKQWTIAGVVAAVVFGPPSWWVMFIEHPETAGMMLTALRVISPVVMFAIGAFTGYKYCSWKSSERRATELAAKDAEIERVKAERTAGFLDLQLRQLAAIRYGIAKGGTFAVPADSDLARELQTLKKLGYADTPDGSIFGSRWHVTADAENAIRNDGACWKLLEESAYYGRFNDDGEYVEVPEEVRGNLRK